MTEKKLQGKKMKTTMVVIMKMLRWQKGF